MSKEREALVEAIRGTDPGDPLQEVTDRIIDNLSERGYEIVLKPPLDTPPASA